MYKKKSSINAPATKKQLPVKKLIPKPRNNALHADCGIETIRPAALSAATIRVFSPK